MEPLEKSLRNKLEKTVKEARDVAEAAAKAALEQFGVAEATPFAHLSETDRELRRRLRIHGRQLGDSLNGGKTQEMERLIEEVAYEHWHRMLFARFLAENNLLMYPDPDNPVGITLEECEDLAADEGARDGWELAARFAARMLPQIFRPDSPVFQLVLPPEHQQRLERLVTQLPVDVFAASDSLGWVYQFWQAKKKDEVNASEVKIGARELPAVTQLFTEPYMVSFLLDNSLGAWWAARCDGETRKRTDGEKGGRGEGGIFQTAESEEEIRRACALPGVPLTYLRFVRTPSPRHVEGDSAPAPSSEPGEANTITVPSPLGGEGQGEGPAWTPAAGTFSGWPQHLKELKTLDPCCGSGHFLVAALLMLVPMRMAVEGLSEREAVNAVLRENIHGLEIDQRCVELAAFALALTAWRYPGAGGYRALPELHLACSGLSVSVAREEWKQFAMDKHNLRIALDWMYEVFKDAPVLGSLVDPAKSDAAKLVQWDDLSQTLEQALSQEQTAEQHEAGVVAHGLAKAATLLGTKYHWVITNVPYLVRGKQDDFLKEFCEKHHRAAKNDLATVFLDRCLQFCVQGGTASIVLPQNWLFLTSYQKFREKLLKNDAWHLIARLGAGAFETISGEVVKAILLTMSRGGASEMHGALVSDNKSNLIRGLDVSGPRTASGKADQLLVSDIKEVEQAKQLKNPDAMVRIDPNDKDTLMLKVASCFQGSSTGDNPRFVSLFWETHCLSKGLEFMESVPEETILYGGKQFVIDWPGVQNFSSSALRGWEAFGKPGIAIGQMCNLPAALYLGYKFPNTTPVIIPYEDYHLSAIWAFCSSSNFAEELRKINQKLSIDNGYVGKVPLDLKYWTKIAQEKYPDGLPKPYSEDPTQWIFHGHPTPSDNPLQVAVARLLGYRWPAEQDGTMELSDDAREWVKKSEGLLSHSDADGIVCIPPVRGEAPAADRLLNLLAAACNDNWSSDTLPGLLSRADHAGKSLETWLRDKFFLQHCKLFHHRPFIWQIWDGLRDGFSALINYHKLDRKTLETVIYTYLGDWLRAQKDAISRGIDGAEEKLAAAENLKKRLELILAGEQPYDIFVRWKPIDKQPIGWDPDLNDGVRLNIRPFMTAGVLRFNKKPQINITWEKDRGKDVESAPWYHLFKGDRINDHHLGLAEKKTALETTKKEAKNG